MGKARMTKWTFAVDERVSLAGGYNGGPEPFVFYSLWLPFKPNGQPGGRKIIVGCAVNAASIDGRKYWNNLIHCCRRCSFLALSQPATPPPRHSGLDPESSPIPVMDPGSKSPRGLGDVRDDVCSVLPSKVLHVIPGLTRNPENPRYSTTPGVQRTQ